MLRIAPELTDDCFLDDATAHPCCPPTRCPNSPTPIEPNRPARDTHKAVSGREQRMKIALLVCLVWHWGHWGGAALGIGAGLAWVEIFKTNEF